jgi:hypothetical protein
MRLLIALVVWAAAIAGAAAVSSAVSGSIHNTPAGTSSFSSTTGGGVSIGGSGGSAVDPSSIKAADKLSLFAAANFDRALARARTALGPGAQVDNFVVYPGYMSIIAVKGGQEIDFYVDANGRVIQDQTGGSPGGTTLFRLSQITPGASAVMAQHIAAAAHVPLSQLHYLVVDPDSEATNKLEWLVYAVPSSSAEYFKASSPKGRLLEYRKNSSTGLQPVSG